MQTIYTQHVYSNCNISKNQPNIQNIPSEVVSAPEWISYSVQTLFARPLSTACINSNTYACAKMTHIEYKTIWKSDHLTKKHEQCNSMKNNNHRFDKSGRVRITFDDLRQWIHIHVIVLHLYAKMCQNRIFVIMPQESEFEPHFTLPTCTLPSKISSIHSNENISRRQSTYK